MFQEFNFLWIFSKCFEDISACDADGIYVVLQNQRWGKRFEYCWWSFENKLHSVIRWRAICIAFSGQLQFGEGVLFILWRYEWKVPWFVRNCVRRKLGQSERESLWKMVGMNSLVWEAFCCPLSVGWSANYCSMFLRILSVHWIAVHSTYAFWVLLSIKSTNSCISLVTYMIIKYRLLCPHTNPDWQ